MIRIGYLEGTDPLFLNELAARGVDTMPLSNGVDSHGKFISHLTKADAVDVVVGYLYKVLPLADTKLSPLDVLHACKAHDIPVLIIAQKVIHEQAAKALKDARPIVTLVDPSELRSAFERAAG